MASFNSDKIRRVANILHENAEYQARQRVMQHMKQPKATELPERESLESEMVKDAPAEKHGHKVDAAGYQEFSTHTVMGADRMAGKSYNASNFGYRTESFSQRESEFIATAAGSLKKQAEAHGLRKEVVFERFVALQADAPAHLVEAVGHKLGIAPSHLEALGVLSEGSYGYAEGGYVSVNPEEGKKEMVKKGTRSAFAADEERRRANAVLKGSIEGDKELPAAQAPATDKPGNIKTDAQLKREIEEQQSYQRLLQIKESVDLYNEILEEEEDAGLRRVAKEKLAKLHSEIKHLKAMSDKRKEDEKKEKEEEESTEAVQAYAEAMSYTMAGEAAVNHAQRLQENQARHLSLLESAKSVLNQSNSFNNSSWS